MSFLVQSILLFIKKFVYNFIPAQFASRDSKQNKYTGVIKDQESIFL